MSLYSKLDAATLQTISANLPQAISDLQTKLQPLLTPYNATANPISDSYTANHQGLAGVLDAVKIDMSATGTISITNKASNATIYSGQMNNFKNGTLTADNISQPQVAVAINPPTANVQPNGTATFAALVSYSTNTQVVWSVVETGGGTISSTGVYTAPATTGIYHVKAVSAADPNKSATTVITVAASTSTSTYNISGSVKTSGGVGISGVTIASAGTGSATTTTDVNGNYSFSSAQNGNYTITPSKTGYAFTPATQTVTVNGADMAGQNFTAAATSASTYSISGTITSGGVALAGVTVSTSGSSATTDASGNYTIGGLANGSYTLTPAKSGYTFSPATLAITVNGANLTGKNFTATATTASTYSITGTITSGGAALADVTVSTSGGSATTDTSGNYTIGGLANGSYTVTPTKSGYAFTPASLTVTVNGANASGKNFTATNTGSIAVGW